MTVRSTPNADDRLSRRRKARSRGTQTGRKDRSGALTAKARPGADKSAATGAPRGARRIRQGCGTIGFALFGAPPPHPSRVPPGDKFWRALTQMERSH
jgi:hypothetical protein